MIEDKNIIPGAPSPQAQDTPDPLAAAENNSDISGGDEIDPDDAVHSILQPPSEENIEQDADDAVHQMKSPPTDSLHENDEKDPDDLVHGK